MFPQDIHGVLATMLYAVDTSTRELFQIILDRCVLTYAHGHDKPRRVFDTNIS